MRICDRCGSDPIVIVLKSLQDGIEYDLCKACRDQFFEFFTKKEEPEKKEPQKRGRRKK